MKFDYVIVGGGSAGCALANRLSANLSKKVALLEAGPPDDSFLIHTPALLGILVGQNRKYNWCFETVPQKHMKNRIMYCPRGKTLGGSSSINAMIYIRGQHEDYDSWNIPGWSWNEIKQDFLNCQNQQNMESVEPEYHSQNGELIVSNQTFTHEYSQLFVKAAEQVGYSLNKDFNGKKQEGMGLYQVTMSKGKRFSSAKSFLTTEVLARPNLKIFTNSQVSKLLFDESKQITGVQYVNNSNLNHLSSLSQISENTKVIEAPEVILSGGATNSPQILLLSGIGPRKHLEEVGIEVKHHLPGVGRNLQDHLDVIAGWNEIGNKCYGVSFGAIPNTLKAIQQYRTQSSGLFASNGAEAGGFITSPGASRPDIQFHFCPSLLEDHARKTVIGHGFSVHACVLRPESRGHIGLLSKHPLASPLIDPNYLEVPEDINGLIYGVKEARKIVEHRLFDGIRGSERHPGAQHQTDEQIKEWVINAAETVYHPVGSCKMGDDDLSVVDSELRVHGMKGLRVADASIMPKLISGNTNAISITIGHKCSTFIRKE